MYRAGAVLEPFVRCVCVCVCIRGMRATGSGASGSETTVPPHARHVEAVGGLGADVVDAEGAAGGVIVEGPFLLLEAVRAVAGHGRDLCEAEGVTVDKNLHL